MRCSKCGKDNREGRKFCAECGTALASKCPRCGVSNEPGEKFCGDCGAALGASAPARKSTADSPIRVAATSASDNLEGERKTLTALFADIKGSTELEQDLDPEEARAIVDPALKLMIEAVQRYDGYVVQSTGDGIFAIFGAPVAREDHPQRALYAALRMQDELRRYSTRLREAGNLPIEARVGVNTGEVVVRSISTGGKTEYTPIGHTANLASRMQALAPTGSIAIAEPTRKLCEGYFALKPLGPTKVKGVSEPVNVYEVTGLGPLRTRLQRAAGRGLTKFVGREREMEAMRATAERATSGRGQIVAAMAEAGTGKSRLFFEFKAKNQSGWMVLEAFSVSHGKASAYLPVLDLLYGYFKITSDDDARSRREKVTGRVLALDRSLEDALPYLFALLGIVEGDDPLAQMDANIRKRRTLDAIKRILLRESLNQPLIVMFEDLHWIDEQTQELLNLLADAIANARILLLVNYRPQYRHDWGSKTYYRQLRLDPLGKESADEMLAALLGDSPELDVLKRTIIERTEGNPLFMEEMVQVLLDEGALVRNGAVHMTKPLGELKIPPTVQGILAARIDRLPTDEKDLLQMLAVIGREFPMSLVRSVVTKSDDELGRMLDDLQLGEFIYQQPAVGDVEYAFKHALTQEVAYGSVLIAQRKVLHRHVAAAIEALFRDSIDDHIRELARHYRIAGELERAIHYLRGAARQSEARSNYSEAAESLEAALALSESLTGTPAHDRQQAELYIALASCVGSLQGGASPQFERVAWRARELCERLGDESMLLSALQVLRWCCTAQLDYRRARVLTSDAMQIAERLGDPNRLCDALVGRTHVLMQCGELAEAQLLGNRALALGEQALAGGTPRSQRTRIVGRSYVALCLFVRGYPEQARSRAEQAMSIATASAQHWSLAFAMGFACQIYRLLGDSAAARAINARSLQIAAERGFSLVEAEALFQRGWGLAQQGEIETGMAEMRRGIEAIEATGARASPWRSWPMAEAAAKLGRADGTLTLIDSALALCEKTGERLYEAELRRVKGEVLTARGASDLASAEGSLREAIGVARRQSAKAWELRATTSLARLLRDSDRRDEARSMLADIYNWFTEGFDTADLKEAKTLLDELST